MDKINQLISDKKNTLLGALAKKHKAVEDIKDADNKIIETNSIIAALEFSLSVIQDEPKKPRKHKKVVSIKK